MTDKCLLTDTEARQAAITANQSFIVTAPAGSGKTETMIQRILNLFAADSKLTKPEQLVGITFTKKAAAELRARLLDALEEAAAEKDPGENPDVAHKKKTYDLACAVLRKDDDLNWQLTKMPSRLRLMTIDSFCGEINRRYSADCGLGATPDIADAAREVPTLMKQAALRTLNKAQDKNTPEMDKTRIAMFLRLYGNFHSKAIEALEAMLQQRDQWKDEVMDAVSKEQSKEVWEIEFIKTQKDAFANQDSPTQMTDVEKEGLEAAIGILPLLLDEYEALLTSRGLTDFSGAAANARRILRKLNESNRDNGIRHLLIDEFQDSSFTQYKLIDAVTKRWQPNDGRTLFVVGDKMQSIYRFREAEVALFQNAQKTARIGNVSLQHLELTKNFRSAPKLVDWFNKTFREIFGTEDDIANGCVEYTMAEPVRNSNDRSDIQVFVTPVGEEEQKVLELVKEFTAELESNRDTERQCAVLVKARTHLGSILLRLRKEGIPYQAVEIDNLQQRQSILDLQSLTAALAHRYDTMSWLAVLRAPWCAATLAEIQDLLETEHTDIADALEQAETLPEHIRRTWNMIQPALAKVHHTHDFSLLVEQAWIALGGPACVTEQADWEGARLFFDVLSGLTTGGTVRSLDELTSAISQLLAPPMAGNGAEHLQVMTIHKSKGLEFDTVIIPGLNRISASNSVGNTPINRAVVAHDDGNITTLWVPGKFLLPVKKDALPATKCVKDINQRKGESEAKRLFYVAATRARERLYLIGAVTIKDGKTSVAKNSFLDFLSKADQNVNARLNAICQDSAEKAEDTSSDSGEDKQQPAELRRLDGNAYAQWWQQRCSDNVRTVLGRLIEQTEANDDTEDCHDETGSVVKPAEPPAEWMLQHGGTSEPDHADLPEFLGKFAAGSVARVAGTVIHAWLERMANDQTWGRGLSNETRISMIRAELRANGLHHTAMLKDATDKVLKGLKAAESDNHKEVIGKHEFDACELDLTVVEEDKSADGKSGTKFYKRYIIDRLWRDKNGNWVIVDYKTSDLKDKQNDAHLIAKIRDSQYDRQLINYGELVHKRFGAPKEKIRRYLYFPMVNIVTEIIPGSDENAPENGCEIRITDTIR